MPAKKDYVPDSVQNLRDWAQTIVASATAQLTGVEGWDAARITAFIARIQAVLDAAQAVLAAQAALDLAAGALDGVLGDQLPEIRQDVANMKKSRGWNDGKGDALGVNTPAAHVDPNTLKPTLNIEEKHGFNRIMAKKFGADSLNIYMRRTGEAAFALLAAKRVRFPLDDDTPSLNGGTQPESREYQAIAVIADQEVGQPSDIVAAVWRQ